MGRPPKNPDAPPAPKFPTTGIDAIRAVDPDARILGTLTGRGADPAVYEVLNEDRSISILVQRGNGRFSVYDETPPPGTDTPDDDD